MSKQRRRQIDEQGDSRDLLGANNVLEQDEGGNGVRTPGLTGDVTALARTKEMTYKLDRSMRAQLTLDDDQHDEVPLDDEQPRLGCERNPWRGIAAPE